MALDLLRLVEEERAQSKVYNTYDDAESFISSDSVPLFSIFHRGLYFQFCYTQITRTVAARNFSRGLALSYEILRELHCLREDGGAVRSSTSLYIYIP